MKRRRLRLAREVVRRMVRVAVEDATALGIRSVVPYACVRGGGQPCSDPTCQVCDTIKPQPGCCG